MFSILTRSKKNEDSQKLIYCFIDYPIIRSNVINCIFQLFIVNEGEINDSIHGHVLSILFKENKLIHNNDKPFD